MRFLLVENYSKSVVLVKHHCGIHVGSVQYRSVWYSCFTGATPLLLQGAQRRVLGCDALCGDNVRRYLAYPAVRDAIAQQVVRPHARSIDGVDHLRVLMLVDMPLPNEDVALVGY